MFDYEALKNAIGDLDEDAVNSLLDDFVTTASAEEAQKALEACQDGMEIVGARYEEGDYFVAELIFAGDVMAQAAALLKPLIAEGQTTSVGKLVICSAKGDIHDIGKNIVKALLEASGVECIDLGVDVPIEKVVDAVKESGSKVLAVSGVLTLAIDAMKDYVDALIEVGIRDEVKVIIGGAVATADYCTFVGADAWSTNAAEGVTICRSWLAS